MNILLFLLRIEGLPERYWQAGGVSWRNIDTWIRGTHDLRLTSICQRVGDPRLQHSSNDSNFQCVSICADVQANFTQCTGTVYTKMAISQRMFVQEFHQGKHTHTRCFWSSGVVPLLPPVATIDAQNASNKIKRAEPRLDFSSLRKENETYS